MPLGKEPSSGQELRSPAGCLEYVGCGVPSWDPSLLSPLILPKGKCCHSSTCENRDTTCLPWWWWSRDWTEGFVAPTMHPDHHLCCQQQGRASGDNCAKHLHGLPHSYSLGSWAPWSQLPRTKVTPDTCLCVCALRIHPEHGWSSRPLNSLQLALLPLRKREGWPLCLGCHPLSCRSRDQFMGTDPARW